MSPSITSPFPKAPAASIPLIPITPLLHPTPVPETLPTAHAILSALRTSGFLYLTQPPLPSSLLPRVFALSAAFFALPQAEKDSLAWKTPQSNRGYVRLGREKVSNGTTKEAVAADREGEGEDVKESFEIGREGDEEGGDNHWPGFSQGDGGPEAEGKAFDSEFRTTMIEFFARCQELHRAVMKGVAIGLGLSDTFFEPYLRRSDNTLRLLHYPGVRRGHFRHGRVRAGAHSDFGSVTLLFQDAAGGLQVERPDGGWVGVKPVEGAVVVNSGDLLARWSNGLVKSTMHRVVEPPRGGSRGQEKGKGESVEGRQEEEEDNDDDELLPPRYSVAYFGNPDFDRWIEALPGTFGGEMGDKKWEGVNSGDYLVERLSATY